MRIYLAGICGTFMAGLAQLAQESGHEVGGCDGAVWPPMSDQLAHAGITIDSGWEADFLDQGWDHIIIGNALSRGNPLVEAVLRRRLPFSSGPQWLYENILHQRKVVAVAGTHGKTTTTAMLAWILQSNDIDVGFLIGGQATDFSSSASRGDPAAPFVIEADEYDTAFFDKRPKFIHYHPDLLVLGNLEFDHADIYATLDDIQRQFHYLIRLVPGDGKILYRAADEALCDVIKQGVWASCTTIGINDEKADWVARLHQDGFELWYGEDYATSDSWQMVGAHNLANAVAAIAAASYLGVTPQAAVRAVKTFQGVARRLELKADVAGVKVYDDFAHHPTAIAATLSGVKARLKANERVLAVFEPCSNSMRMGTHCDSLAAAFQDADRIFLYRRSDLEWDPAVIFAQREQIQYFSNTDELLLEVCAQAQSGDHIIVMSNGAFDGLPQRIKTCLQKD